MRAFLACDINFLVQILGHQRKAIDGCHQRCGGAPDMFMEIAMEVGIEEKIQGFNDGRQSRGEKDGNDD